MKNERMQHCFNCGEELGVYRHIPGDEPECCGSRECLRELRSTLAEERDERMYRAQEDDYGRY